LRFRLATKISTSASEARPIGKLILSESLKHRKNINAVKNTPILTSFLQPKKASHMQTAVVAGPTQAWQPVTGADEATVVRVATVTAGEQLPHNDVINVDVLALADKSAPCALGLQLVQKLQRLGKGLPSSIPAGVSDSVMSSCRVLEVIPGKKSRKMKTLGKWLIGRSTMLWDMERT
jgi:hypothetical protein